MDLMPTDEETKDVYARFGLAHYMSEVLHRSLCILYLFTRLPEDG